LHAKKVEKRLTEQAEKKINAKFKKAESLIQAKQQQMERQLQIKFSQAVIETTEKLLRNSLGKKAQREIIKKQIQLLKKVRFA